MHRSITMRPVELLHDETTYGPDVLDMPVLVLYLDYAASTSIEYGNAESRKPNTTRGKA